MLQSQAKPGASSVAEDEPSLASLSDDGLRADAPGPRPVDLPGRIEYVDGLRGLAILMVLVDHSWGFVIWRGAPVFSSPLDQVAIRMGSHGVALFLVLSGFCLSYPVWRRHRAGDAVWFQARHFFARRALRILPPYYAALGLTYLLDVVLTQFHSDQYFGGIPSLADMLTHILLIHNMTFYLADISNPFWSLGLEWQWYFVFPLVLLLCVYRPRLAALLCFSVALVWGLSVYNLLVLSGKGGMHTFLNDPTVWKYLSILLQALPARMTEFCGGILAARWAVDGRILPSRWLALCAPILIVIPDVLQSIAPAVGYPLLYPIRAIGYVAVVVLVRQVGILNRIFSWRPLILVGIASYSMYLVHEQCARLTWTFLPTWLQQSYWFVAIGVTVGLIGGVVFHLLIERPVMRRSTWVRFGPWLTMAAAWTDRPWAWLVRHIPAPSYGRGIEHAPLATESPKIAPG